MADAAGHVDHDDQQLHQPPEKEEEKTHISQNLRVLALDDNVICLTILVSQLRKCGYQVTATTKASEALELLRKNKDAYDIVITDVVRPDIDGFKLLEIIGLEWDIPVIMTSAEDNVRTVEKGIRHGARDYLVKPVRIEILQNIWQHVLRKMLDNPKSKAMEVQTDGNSHPYNKRLQSDEDVSGQSTEESPLQKKPRVSWVPDLHQKFLLAVEQLDVDKAVPKKILELMNEPNLTRENVASHLQKYRNVLKKAKGQAMTRNPMDGVSHFYNPITPAAVGNHGLTINYNNSFSGHGMSSFTGMNHPFQPLNYNDNIVLQQRRFGSGDVNQRWKKMAIPVLQNVSPDTTLAADPESTAMMYQKIQKQRNMVDHNYGQISSQLTTTGVGPTYPVSSPNWIVGNSSGSLPMLSSRPYSYSPVSFDPTVPHQVGYTQPFPASSSVRGNNGHRAQPFPAASSVGENNGHLALPFPAASSVGVNNGIHLALPFPAGNSVGVNNGAHLALPFAAGSSVRENNGHYAKLSPASSSVGKNNGHIALPFPTGSSVRKDHGHPTQPFPAHSSVRGYSGHHFQPFPADSSVRENRHPTQPFPANSIRENNTQEMEIEDSLDDELNVMVKQFANYNVPSI